MKYLFSLKEGVLIFQFFQFLDIVQIQFRSVCCSKYVDSLSTNTTAHEKGK